jgi:predicted NUDIX family NTP pyrophosphohydrolase
MKRSAGLLLFRRAAADRWEVLLVHPAVLCGRRRTRRVVDPKGELAEDEDPLQGALREFAEETATT